MSSGHAHLLIREMAHQCRQCIESAKLDDSQLPQPLGGRHLLWMCRQIERKIDEWPESKMHRWIGFIQCALLANGALDLEELKTMFDEAKTAYGDPGQDLLDHLDPDHPFEFDLGDSG